MEKIVGLRELRENIAVYASRVKCGQSFVVMKKSSPLFRISPIEDGNDAWEEVADFTKIRKGGIEIEELIGRL
jgi:antitoxin (DNA-binding transcriptional repressor) of toxin-antitoxin stability system